MAVERCTRCDKQVDLDYNVDEIIYINASIPRMGGVELMIGKIHLEPCPICGELPTIKQRQSDSFPFFYWWRIGCLKTYVDKGTDIAHEVSVFGTSEDDAINKWNTTLLKEGS
jgi:endogenous inhibitor of DNA gyrase (YacG/DUF329 family)